MTKIFIIIALAAGLFLLVRSRLIHVDLSFPWFFAIIILGLASTQDSFVNWIGGQLGILYAPIAIVFMVMFILLALITILLIGLTRLRNRQIQLVRQLASIELSQQENKEKFGHYNSDDLR